MRILYALVFAFLNFSILHGQELGFGPPGGNAIVRSFSDREQVRQEAEIERLIGHNPLSEGIERGPVDCPPDVLTDFIVKSGNTIDFTIDTVGLGGGTGSSLTCLGCAGNLQFGLAVFDESLLRVDYFSTPSVEAGIDSIAFEICNSGTICDTFFYSILVRRNPKSIIADPVTVATETVTTYCLDDELDLPGKRSCTQIEDYKDNYDGQGQQLFSLTDYTFPDTCMLYYSNRFPGKDTIKMVLCDEFAICDTFKIPFIIIGDTITTLPVFDDFSYAGPFPTADLWLDKQTFVNKTFAKDPPSVGIVTFDGVDRKGKPYNIISGVGDRLTSKAIDLSGFTANEEVVLKFFIAPKGFGLAPDAQDSLKLEFRNDQRQWVAIDAFPGFENNVPLDSFPPFVFKSYRVDDPSFLHGAFQFRFTAYTSPGGMVDLWHLDYVRLSTAEGEDDTFEDVAFTTLPTSILKNYSSMPWRHFEGQEEEELQDKVASGFFNHFDLVTNIEDSRASFRETVTGANFNQTFTLVDGQEANMPVKENAFREKTIPGGVFSNILNFFKNIPFGDHRNLETEFSLQVAAQQEEFKINDTVRLNNPFEDYFAYDDGTAEQQVFIRFAQGGEQIAVKYHANIDDTLRAVRFLFPFVNGDVQTQLFNLRVWVGGLDSEPVFERQLLKPFYPNNKFDTLQGFTTYRLDNILGNAIPTFIPAGDFYVGWQQITPGDLGIPVGFDVQNPCDDCNFANLSGSWSPFPSSPRGAVMIRPVFSKEAPLSTSVGTTEVQALSKVMDIFPNPTAGSLFINLKKGSFRDYHILIFNNMGQLIQELPLKNELNLQDLQSGVYFLKILNLKTQERFNHKVVVVKYGNG